MSWISSGRATHGSPICNRWLKGEPGTKKLIEQFCGNVVPPTMMRNLKEINARQSKAGDRGIALATLVFRGVLRQEVPHRILQLNTVCG